MTYKKIIKCGECKKEIIARTSTRNYCDVCAKMRHYQRVLKWRDNNREKVRELTNKYNRARYNLNNEREKRMKNLNGYRARYLTKRIKILSCCEECGSTENLQKHHPNYSKPMEVKTLCVTCHVRLHKCKPMEVVNL